MGGRFITVVLHRDGAIASRAFKLPLWAFQAAGVLLGLAVLFIVAVLLLFAPLVRAAARVPGLEAEVRRLEGEAARVHELAAALDSVEARYGQLRQMIGVDVVPDPARAAAKLPVAAAVRTSERRFEKGPSVPSHWPLDANGYLTRGQAGSQAGGRAGGQAGGDSGGTTAGADGAHPGIDVAVPMGTPVRASGGGAAAEVGQDSVYGRYVLLRHPDGYESMYGHLSRITVASGDSVPAGTVIGLSGNSGRSTAPHLHFEIRRAGRSVDPLGLIKENR